MAPLAPNLRQTFYNPVVPTTDFPVGFPLFDNADVILLVDEVSIPFTVTATYDSDGVSTDAVCKVPMPGVAGNVTVVGIRNTRRTDQYVSGRPLHIPDHNYSLNRLTAEIQEVRRDVARAVKTQYGVPGKQISDIAEGHFWIADAAGNMTDGGSAADITHAQEYAQAAAASAQEALVHEQNAGLILEAVEDALEEVTPDKLQFVGDGLTTHFPLGRAAAIEIVDPYISGVYQQQDSFSISGSGAASEIVFAVAPPAPTIPLAPNIEIRFGGQSSLATSILSPEQVGTVALATGAVTDIKVNPSSLLSNRILDMSFLTDFLSAGKRAALRGGAFVDVTAELQAADAALPSGSELHLPVGNLQISAQVDKRVDTWWTGTGSDVVGTAFYTVFDGNSVKITGTRLSRAGGMRKMRFIGNQASYPNAIAINAESVITHTFEDIRIGLYAYGIYGYDCAAFIFNNVYVFTCSLDGVKLTGPLSPARTSTDHRFYDCQFTGDRYGFAGENCVTLRFVGCRPQASGVANMFLDNSLNCIFSDGYNDSGIIHSSGGGVGFRLRNCRKVIINNVIMYSNGPVAMIDIIADGANGINSRVEDIQLKGISMQPGSGQAGVTGIICYTPTGVDASIRGLMIDACDFRLVAGAVAGLNNVDCELHIGANFGNDASIGKVQTLINPSGTIEIDARAEIVRLTGTISSTIAIVVTGRGNYFNKPVKIVRSATGAGLVNVRGPNGVTLLGTLPAAGSSLEVYCNSGNVAPASATFLEI